MLQARAPGTAPLAVPLLPPAYQLVVLDRGVDPFARAVRQAPRGLDDGTVYWTDRADLLAMAVALEPEAGRAATLQAVHVLAVAAGDALGALLPPQLPLQVAWPGGVVLDGARLGRVRAAAAPGADGEAPPAWLVLGLELLVGPPGPGEPGLVPDVTSLAEAGAAEATPPLLAEAVGRHFLAWTHRWLEEGFAPVQAAWNARCLGRGEVATLGPAEGGPASGEVRGLDAGGALLIGEGRVPLEAALGALS